MSDMTDEAVKATAHKFRFAQTQEQKMLAELATALLDARAELARVKADAQAAVAMVVEKAAEVYRTNSETFETGVDVAIRALAPESGIALVAELRAKIETLLQREAEAFSKQKRALEELEKTTKELAAAQEREAGPPEWLHNCVVCKRVIDGREQEDGGDPHGFEHPEGWVCSAECGEVLHPTPQWMTDAMDAALASRPDGGNK